eukprot:TRINITY_DN27194_c0_g3_i1.p1 TRINITY_DN27194_c0_g3~~TRINITY_DN27194_c0_g3_i1.p1  ORF type:complete len:441 (-),score=76.11 TRINITY_DN27194_c0_g3_i1:365-1687(-)
MRVNATDCPELPRDKFLPGLEDALDDIPVVSAVMDWVFDSKPSRTAFEKNLDKEAAGMKKSMNSAVAGMQANIGGALPASPLTAAANMTTSIGGSGNGMQTLQKTAADAVMASKGHNTEQCEIFAAISSYKFIILITSLVLPVGITWFLGFLVKQTTCAHEQTRDARLIQEDSWWLWGRRWCFWPLLYFWWRFMEKQVPAVKYANDAKMDSLCRCLGLYSPPSVYVCVTYLLFCVQIIALGVVLRSPGTSFLLGVAFGTIFSKAANWLLASTPLARSETERRIQSWRPGSGVKVYGKMNVLEKILKASDAGLRQLALTTSDFLQLNQLGPDVRGPAAFVYPESLEERVGGDTHPDAVAIIKSVYHLDAPKDERIINLHTGEVKEDHHGQDMNIGEEHDEEDGRSNYIKMLSASAKAAAGAVSQQTANDLENMLSELFDDS